LLLVADVMLEQDGPCVLDAKVEEEPERGDVRQREVHPIFLSFLGIYMIE
jgi:hypothetical protein